MAQPVKKLAAVTGEDELDLDAPPEAEPAVKAVEPEPESEPEPEAPAEAEPKPADGWTHETLEFKGDTIEARKPTQQALAAFSLATSKYVSPQTQNEMTSLFIMRHLSPTSFERVFNRLMDPDETDYDINTIGALMREVANLP